MNLNVSPPNTFFLNIYVSLTITLADTVALLIKFITIKFQGIWQKKAILFYADKDVYFLLHDTSCI